MQRIALLLACCACLRAQPAAVEGTVVNRATGEPVAGVHVRFASLDPAADGQPYGATSDRAGHFSLTSLPAGIYMADALRRGYFYMPPKGDPMQARVSLKAGQQLAGFKIEMAQGATISGRVLDDNGDTVQVDVQAEPETTQGADVQRSANNDERGEFQISVAPGKYYLVAGLHGVRGGFQEPEIGADGMPEPTYGKTYYPGAAAKAKAVPVEVAPGAELNGMDIHLARIPHGGSISGVVTGGGDVPGANIVTLRRGVGTGHMRGDDGTAAATDGSFRFANLDPGTYRVAAIHLDAEGRLYSRPVEVHVENGDVTGVSLVLGPGGTVTGKVVMAPGDDGVSKPATALGGFGAEKLSVSLEPATPGPFPEKTPSGTVDASGVFRISDVAPGRYHLHVTPIPENAYLKSVRLDGAEASGDEVDLSRGAPEASLEIVVSGNGAQISGKLLDEKGEPLGAGFALVLLFTNPKAIVVGQSMKMTEDGTYSFSGLRPGKYRLLALNQFRLAGVDDFQEAAQKLAGRAEEIEIKAGESKVHDLKLLGKEGADAKGRR